MYGLSTGVTDSTPGDGGDRLLANRILGADDADDGAQRAAADIRLEAPLGDPIDDVLDLLLGGFGFGDDDHGKGRES